MMRKVLFANLVAALAILGVLFLKSAFANIEQIKLYKAAFPGEKPKCTACHMDKTPKKEAGKHDPSPYGQKVLKLKTPPDEETYKAAGKNETAESG